MFEDASKAGNAKADVAQRWGRRVPIVIGATGHRTDHLHDGTLGGDAVWIGGSHDRGHFRSDHKGNGRETLLYRAP